MEITKVALIVFFLFGIPMFGQSATSSENQQSNATVSGSGCVTAGIEGGCFVLTDSKSKETFNLFFKDDFPKLDTAISFQGTENNNPNFCMQGKAVDVAKWTAIRMHCSSGKGESHAISENASKCKGWDAWHNVQPTAQRHSMWLVFAL